MLRRKLLVILASIFAASSADIQCKKCSENWVEQKPFQNIMSWYLKHAYDVTVQVVHREGEVSMYQRSSKLISVIHEKSNAAVSVTHHVIDAEGRHFYGNNSFSNPNSTHPVSNASSSDWKRPALIQSMTTTYGKCMTILLIPDEATFEAFLTSGGFWRRHKVKLMLIIVIPESLDTLCNGIPGKRGWKESVRNILGKVWSEDKVLNIFLVAPRSACIKGYLFSWNPFTTSTNSGSGAVKRLEINAENPNIDKALTKFAISSKNMKGYPLKVVIFERLPTLFITSDGGPIRKMEENPRFDINKISGLDGLVLKTLSSWLNCTVEFHLPSDGQMYGYQMQNGTFVGMTGDIVYRRVDFGANGVFLKDYQTGTAAEFTDPIACESICIAVPRAGMIPQWLQIFQCFSPLVWNLLFFNVVIYGLLRHILRTLLRERHPRRNLLEIVIETALIFLSSPQNLPKLNSERILVGFYLLFNVIVVGTFQGTLYEGFTNPDYYENIDTLTDLDDSGLQIGTGSPNLLNIFGEDDDLPVLTHLRQKVQVTKATWEWGTIDRAAWEQDIAAIERKNDLQLSINTKFHDKHGEPVLHVVQECPRTYHLTYMVPTGAFFLGRMNVLLRRMVEAGLIPHWYNSTVESIIMKNHYAMAKEFEMKDKTVPFNLKNLQISFIVLTSGVLLSILVFIGEMVLPPRKIPRGRTIPKISIAARNFASPS